MRDSRRPNYHCAIFKCPLLCYCFVNYNALGGRTNFQMFLFRAMLTGKLMLKIFLIEVDHKTTPRANYLRKSESIQRIAAHRPLNSYNNSLFFQQSSNF